MTRISFLIPRGEKVKQSQGMRRMRAHFRATDYAAPLCTITVKVLKNMVRLINNRKHRVGAS